ncbi:30S ribosomal protein S20 [Candidatus Uhrbacteria bacterium]|nr:30S ribosomal protein S20 [Candidatus Uhrbacteria bacterium]
MPHKQAAIKALRQTKKRTEHNALVKKNIAYLRKSSLKAVAAKDLGKAQEYFVKLQKAIDKAAGKNIIKKNTAARKKARLIKKIHALAK